jgi:hypothetical protein
MGNIIGKPFVPWVKKQIETRQQALGKYSNITEDIIKAYHTKAPFLRLASGIDVIEALQTTTKTTTKDKTTTIDETTKPVSSNSLGAVKIEDGAKDSLESIGITGITGTAALARKCILQGGVLNENKLNSGLSSDGSLQGAYGWGGTDERGYIPMPGIIKADVKYLNNGALAQATVNIKCFSRKQFQIIDMLYMRPGYTVLLEWGHSVYLDNSNELKSFNTLFSQPIESLLNPGEKDQYKILDEITAEREKYNGNYDAILGKVAKFNWTFNQDGSYDITVYITGYGDVIESLKINITGDDKTNDKSKSKTPKAKDDDPPIIANARKTMINKWLYNIYRYADKETGIFFDNTRFFDSTLKNYPDPTKNFKNTDLIIKNAVFLVDDVNVDDAFKNSFQAFIRLPYLLAWLETTIFLYHKKNDTKTPLFRFNWNFTDLEKDTNYYLKLPYQISGDPSVCLIPPHYDKTLSKNLKTKSPKSKYSDNKNKKDVFYSLDTDIESDLFKALKSLSNDSKINQSVGKMSYIYINIEYIAKILDSIQLDEDNGLPLLDFLKQIFADVNESLGGINNFTITVDSNTNLINIYDDVPLSSKNFPQEEEIKIEDFTLIQTYGVKQDRGSFVRDLSLNAELSNNFAAQVTIGAQAGGNQPSGNAGSFSEYNKGLWDRLIPSRISSTEKQLDKETDKETLEQEEEIRETLIDAIKDVYTGPGGSDAASVESAIITNLKAPLTEFTQYILGELTDSTNPTITTEDNASPPAPFFIPFNLSVTLDGISGIKLYEQFQINDEILPLSYSNNKVGVIVKGLNHSIDINGWVTKLETQTSILPIEKTPNKDSSNSPVPNNQNTPPQSNTISSTSSSPGAEFNVTPTYNNKTKRSIIDTYGWPIDIVKIENGIYYSKVKSLDGRGRNVYYQSTKYSTDNIVLIEYKSKANISYKWRLHKALKDPLIKVLKQIDDKNLMEYARDIQASIYTRDTTNAPGNLSGHAFGVAMDVNAGKFPYGDEGYNTYIKALSTPADKNHKFAKVVEIIVNSNLFAWGGNYKKDKDAHHFSVLPYNI